MAKTNKKGFVRGKKDGFVRGKRGASSLGVEEEGDGRSHVFMKILGVNFLINIAYFIILYIFVLLPDKSTEYQGFGFAILILLFIALHSAINFILGIVFLFKKNDRKAIAFIVNAFLIFLIAFGVCFGGSFVLGIFSG